MKPLAGFDIGALYNRYHAGVDFILYLFILIPTCRLALTRLYPGTYGRSLGTAMGVVMAISLSIAERTLGFSMRSFGPIAAGIVIMMATLTIYSLMRHVGASHVTCGTTALIITYFTMRAVLPGFFLWAQKNEWASYLHALLVLAILVAIWRVIQAMFTPHEVSALKHAVKNVSGNSGGFIDVSRRGDASEWRTVRHWMIKLTLQGKRECKKVIEILEKAREIVLKHGSDEHVAADVCKALNDLKAREHVLVSQLERIRAVDKQLERFDLSQYRNLQQAYQRLSKEQQAQCKRLFAEERDKLAVEGAIDKYASRAEGYATQFNQCVDNACNSLQARKGREAADWITRAVEQEHEAEKLIEDMRQQEKVLLSLLGRQIAELDAMSRK